MPYAIQCHYIIYTHDIGQSQGEIEEIAFIEAKWLVLQEKRRHALQSLVGATTWTFECGEIVMLKR